MPPRTRSTKTSKLLKENIGSLPKTKLKGTVKVTKPTRKALSDKTNSASDDNASVEIPKKVTLKPTVRTVRSNVLNEDLDINSENRPRRDRRLPNRYVESEVLKNLSNSKENVSKPEAPVAKVIKLQSPEKGIEPVVSPFKTPNNDRDTSLTVTRPKRVCRLPSRFEEHSISPNKFIPLQPSHASTPLVQKNGRNSTTESNSHKSNTDNKNDKSKTFNTPAKKEQSKISNTKQNTIKKVADTNNNAKQHTTLRERKADSKNQLSPPTTTVNRKELKRNKKPLDKNFSFRVLENAKQSLNHDESNLDIYEFTYDPNEEPPPQKKKRKRVATKKPTKPKQKTVKFFKDNYNQNISKTLAALKNVVSQKPNQRNKNINKENTQTAIKAQNLHNLQAPPQDTVNTVNTPQNNENNHQMNGEKESQVSQNTITTNNANTNTPADVSNLKNAAKIAEKHASIRVEDIAADFELSLGHHEIDYSPVNSPHPVTPNQSKGDHSTEKSIAHHNDPLNLREDPSFFDDQPVASSSMNTSVRHPQASPWRCEFQNLPIKWHVNSYVKPNMTPAVECSFVNFDDNKKKHVYTDLVPHTNDTLPEIVEKDAPNLIQKSIISFIKEVAEKQANKKRGRSATPSGSIFEEIPNVSANNNTDNANKTAKRLDTPKKNTSNQENSTENISNDKDTSKSSRKRKNNSDDHSTPAKTPRKENDKQTTFFGFDESGDQDQENISPKNNVDSRKLRGLRPRAKAVLKEINEQRGPFRAVLLIAAKTKALNSHADELFDAMKSTTDAPVFPEKNIDNREATDVNQVSVVEEINDDDSQSVHLFEDIELVHHLKPLRKSYGKAKKVAFRPRSLSDSDTQDSQDNRAEPEESGEEDDLADLTFEMPVVEHKRVHKKNPTKKQKRAKKEEQEADAWAAGFNSMCEDVEDFPLEIE